MFKKILVANRGEIAVRIMRSLREMGIDSVAVYSEADAAAAHVACADESVLLGASEPAESYLNVEKLIAAAKDTGAEAIHPGYGFLSENPEFPRAVVAAGLVFIGPGAEVMELLGDKTSARRLMNKSGVPLTPGMDRAAESVEELQQEAEKIGYPVLIKASAGGGGKGMRVVAEAADLAEAAELAKSEALTAFGDGTIYLEKYIEKPRHVEIQVLADSQGNAVHLFERECSIQRRHQKIIEETPSPVLNPDLRERMGQAALAAVKAAAYINAGTVEFLLDEDMNFYFLEVNTRLQVEHPITEMITGLDIVRCQVEIADGQPLAFKQEDLQARGHAIECRIYAEDPEMGFMPSPGKILLAETPQGPGVRYDSGIYSGAEVPMYYDPILGKLIVYAETRDAAIARMIRALGDCVVLGVKTSVCFMMEVLDSEAFRAGATHTHFIEEHFPDYHQAEEQDKLALIGAMLESEQVQSSMTAGPVKGRADYNSPWQRLGKWDLVD